MPDAQHAPCSACLSCTSNCSEPGSTGSSFCSSPVGLVSGLSTSTGPDISADLPAEGLHHVPSCYGRDFTGSLDEVFGCLANLAGSSDSQAQHVPGQAASSTSPAGDPTRGKVESSSPSSAEASPTEAVPFTSPFSAALGSEGLPHPFALFDELHEVRTLKGEPHSRKMISLVQPSPMPTCQECHLPGSSSSRLFRCLRLRLSLPWITVLSHTEGWYSTSNLAVAAFVCSM